MYTAKEEEEEEEEEEFHLLTYLLTLPEQGAHFDPAHNRAA